MTDAEDRERERRSYLAALCPAHLVEQAGYPPEAPWSRPTLELLGEPERIACPACLSVSPATRLAARGIIATARAEASLEAAEAERSRVAPAVRIVPCGERYPGYDLDHTGPHVCVDPVVPHVSHRCDCGTEWSSAERRALDAWRLDERRVAYARSVALLRRDRERRADRRAERAAARRYRETAGRKRLSDAEVRVLAELVAKRDFGTAGR